MYIKKKEFKKLNELEKVGELATMTLASHIFNYIGGGETIEQLKQSVANVVSPEELEGLEHRFIIKDCLGPTFNIVNELGRDDVAEDDTDSFTTISLFESTIK